MGKFSLGEKAPKQTAINELTVMISNYFGGRYEVIATADDGGTMLEVQVEVTNTAESVLSQHS